MTNDDQPEFPYTIRKVWFPGGSAAIYLPHAWIRKHDIRSHPHITILQNDDGSLTIRSLPEPTFVHDARNRSSR